MKCLLTWLAGYAAMCHLGSGVAHGATGGQSNRTRKSHVHIRTLRRWSYSGRYAPFAKAATGVSSMQPAALNFRNSCALVSGYQH
jgi:hypothetical protein